MKVYAIKGNDGEPGYLKQSMKLPKSWAAKPLLEVLELFCATYNKKFPDTPISKDDHHFERPRGSTLFPDDQVGAALTDYCDVWVVPGAVKYKGPPPGTAAALEAEENRLRAEAEAEAARRTAEEEAKLAAEGKLKDQWRVKVKCVELDRGGMDVKSQYKIGDAVQVTIEPHATVGMLSNRIGLIVGSHPKHQFISHPRDPEAVLDPLAKLKDVMSEQVVLLLRIRMPDTRKVIEELSDDEGVVGEEGPFPDAPVEGECVDVAKRDKLMEECATNPTLENLSACLACGGAAASTLCKRAQLLLKAQRPRAAALDASAALALNPDSARAYKIRGRARRLAADYEGAAADFGQAQRIDFDPDVRPDLVYCSTRSAKIRAIKLAEEHNAALDAAKAEGEAQ